jgi:hypothetical protein
MMQKISVQIALLVAVFIIGILVGMYFSDLSKSSAGKKCALNEYLIFSIQNILSQAPDKRTQFLSESESLPEVSKNPNLSSAKGDYYWFTFNPNIAVERGLKEIDGGTTDFHGYYVVITPDGNIRDFGFHKP